MPRARPAQAPDLGGGPGPPGAGHQPRAGRAGSRVVGAAGPGAGADRGVPPRSQAAGPGGRGRGPAPGTRPGRRCNVRLTAGAQRTTRSTGAVPRAPAGIWTGQNATPTGSPGHLVRRRGRRPARRRYGDRRRGSGQPAAAVAASAADQHDPGSGLAGVAVGAAGGPAADRPLPEVRRQQHGVCHSWRGLEARREDHGCAVGPRLSGASDRGRRRDVQLRDQPGP